MLPSCKDLGVKPPKRDNGGNPFPESKKGTWPSPRLRSDSRFRSSERSNLCQFIPRTAESRIPFQSLLPPNPPPPPRVPHTPLSHPPLSQTYPPHPSPTNPLPHHPHPLPRLGHPIGVQHPQGPALPAHALLRDGPQVPHRLPLVDALVHRLAIDDALHRQKAQKARKARVRRGKTRRGVGAESGGWEKLARSALNRRWMTVAEICIYIYIRLCGNPEK